MHIKEEKYLVLMLAFYLQKNDTTPNLKFHVCVYIPSVYTVHYTSMLLYYTPIQSHVQKFVSTTTNAPDTLY